MKPQRNLHMQIVLLLLAFLAFPFSVNAFPCTSSQSIEIHHEGQLFCSAYADLPSDKPSGDFENPNLTDEKSSNTPLFAKRLKKSSRNRRLFKTDSFTECRFISIFHEKLALLSFMQSISLQTCYLALYCIRLI